MTGVYSKATTGMGTLLKRGDGGIGAGAQASKVIGTSNAQLKILAKLAGLSGNGKAFGIVVAGNSTAYSQIITPSSVLINAATDSGGVSLTKVGQAISNLYGNADFASNFQASVASGDGSGVLVAGASGNLTGGTDGVEIFTEVSEVTDISGPQESQSIVEVTHTQSPNNHREYISSLLDAGQISANANFLDDDSQKAVRGDMRAQTRGNYQIIFTTQDEIVTWSFACFVAKFQPTFKMTAAKSAAITLQVTGDITETTVPNS